MDTLPLTVLKGTQPKHLLPSHPLQRANKDTIPVSLVQTRQVIRLKELISLVMECLQVPRLVMGASQLLSLVMAMATEHNKVKSHLQTPQFMARRHSHPALQGATVSKLLSSQAIPILSHHRLVMLSQILVPSVVHPAMVQQLLSLDMGLRLMVHHRLVNQVMDRFHHIIPLMGVVTLNRLYTLLMEIQVVTVAALMMVHQLHRVLNRVELPKHPRRVKEVSLNLDLYTS